MTYRVGSAHRMLFAVLFTIGVVLGGCSDDEPMPDPCDEVTCSDHGVCRVVDQQPSCACDPGFEPEGLNCVATDEECTPDCSGRFCGPDPICGEPCGTCGANEACKNGHCELNGCTSDSECEYKCVNRRCVDCRTNEDCQDIGHCWTASWFCPLDGDPCGEITHEAFCNDNNECRCPEEVCNASGEECCDCGWRENF